MADMALNYFSILAILKDSPLRDPQVPEAASYGIYEQEGPLAVWQTGQS